MNYTIGEFNEVHGNLTITFDKSGNGYTVGIYNRESKEYTHRTWVNERESAHNVYLTLVKWCLTSWGSEAYRRNYLMTA